MTGAEPGSPGRSLSGIVISRGTSGLVELGQRDPVHVGDFRRIRRQLDVLIGPRHEAGVMMKPERVP